MTGPDRIVSLWEACADLHPQERALRLLLAAEPDATRDTLAQLSIGERDRRLLRLFQAWFGDAIAAVDACPRCGERVELGLSVEALLAEVPAPGPLELTLEGCTVRFRPLNTDDLLAVRDAPSPELGARLLLERVLLQGRPDREATDAASAIEPDALSSALDAADPLAEIQLWVSCPACEHGWSSLLEIVDHLWVRVGQEARQALWEVHALASAYGWSEDQVLALSPRRRRWYVERVGA